MHKFSPQLTLHIFYLPFTLKNEVTNSKSLKNINHGEFFCKFNNIRSSTTCKKFYNIKIVYEKKICIYHTSALYIPSFLFTIFGNGMPSDRSKSKQSGLAVGEHNSLSALQNLQ